MAKKKTNKFLWIVLIAVVVVALVGAYFYYNGMGSYTRNGGRFTADSGSSLNVQIKDYYFNYSKWKTTEYLLSYFRNNQRTKSSSG